MQAARKTALVTGGNRGIGMAIARGLHAAGHDVVIGSRDAQAGVTAATQIGCRSVALDLQVPERFPAMIEACGGVDILVNNAGVLDDGPMLDNPEDFARAMQVMVHAPYALIRLAVPHMRRRSWGRIVNVSSGWGSFGEGLNGPGPYGVAKAALNALTHALPRELGADIKVNAMCPGWVHTRMGGATAPRSPEEGARTALWLAQLPVDGPTGGFFRDCAPIKW